MRTQHCAMYVYRYIYSKGYLLLACPLLLRRMYAYIQLKSMYVSYTVRTTYCLLHAYIILVSLMMVVANRAEDNCIYQHTALRRCRRITIGSISLHIYCPAPLLKSTIHEIVFNFPFEHLIYICV